MIDDAAVERELARWRVPALTLGLLEGDTTTVRAYGAAREGDRFHVASVTKPMVAHLCFALGLPLDEPLWEDCTLRHCLAHQTGIDGEPDEPLRFGDGDDAAGRIVAELGSLRRWEQPPALWSYSNPGYWLAGLACAERAGSTFEEAMARHVFEPFEMSETSFEGATVEAAGERYPRARRPSGGVVSTAADLLRFAAGHLSPHPSHERQTKAVGSDWALGWGRTRTLVFHPGGWGGYASLLLVSTERPWALVALTNADSGGAAIEAIVEQLLGREQPARVEAAVDGFAGTYRRRGAEVTFRPRDGGLEAEAQEADTPPYRVWGYPTSPTTFYVSEGEDRGSSFDFPRPGTTRFGFRRAERS